MQYASYFTGRGDTPHQYPWMSANEQCDVLIIGGGITGCCAAYELSKAGINVALLSQKPIGFSSTAVNNSALSYLNDLFLIKLANTIGKEKAIECFSLCSSTLDELEQFAQSRNDFSFCRRDTFLYVSDASQSDELHTEYLMRKHNGLNVEFLDRQDAGELFSFDVQSGILAKNGGGEADGYLLCHSLAQAAQENGARIYENTTVVSIENTENGIYASTDNERHINAKKIVMAIGWRQEEYLHSLVSKKTVFTVATTPTNGFSGYESRALVKNLSTNVSMRTTEDNRVITWGLNCSLPEKTTRFAKLLNTDKIAERKYSELSLEMGKMLCGITGINSEYACRGVYGITKDNLPIIGTHPNYENVYFDMPSGDNAILFALMGGKIIADLYHGKQGENIFSPNRESL